MLQDTAQNEYRLVVVEADITENRTMRKGAKLHYARQLPNGRMTGPLCGCVSRVAWQYSQTLAQMPASMYCRRCRTKFKLLPLTLADARNAAETGS